jgi:2-polyprenyl-3-methyl-5-hydroxy-6-metoxy-1,4-benzoquinol methylase
MQRSEAMAPPFEQRVENLRERLEDPAAEISRVRNTYRQFFIVNRLFSRWDHLYRRFLRPLMADPSSTYTLLDIGCGGGDIDLRLLSWAERDGRDLQITAIDRNEQALAIAREQARHPALSFRQVSLEKLSREGQTFDFIISNHVLHELVSEVLLPFLAASQAMAQKLVLFSDVARSTWGAAAFTISMGPFLHHSFTVEDGITSLRRAYTVKELRALAPPPWQVEPLFPSRLLLELRK